MTATLVVDAPAMATWIRRHTTLSGLTCHSDAGSQGDFLAARPGEAFGPTAVGKALGRSQGAVSNSLAAMTVRGEVEMVGDKPRRYGSRADRRCSTTLISSYIK